MYFEIISEVTDIEVIAKGRAIRELARLRKKYGSGTYRRRSNARYGREFPLPHNWHAPQHAIIEQITSRESRWTSRIR